MNILELKKVPVPAWLSAIFMWIAIISPGVLIVLVHKPEMFISLDIVKLIMIGSAMTFPVWILNCLMFAFYNRTNTPLTFNIEMDALFVALVGSLLSVPVLYIPILARFLFQTPLRVNVIMIICFEVLLFAGWLRMVWVAESKKEKKKN